MTEIVKKDDFIELEYTAKVKTPEIVFDTTSAELAAKNGLKNPGIGDGPRIICLGRGQILKGLDNALQGKEIGKDLTIELNAENAFGKKDPNLVTIIPEQKFKKAGIKPMPGFQFDVDGSTGTVRSVNGGRVIVDFNDPLAGKDIIYEIKIIRKVNDLEEKIKGFLNLSLNVKKEAIEIKEKEINVDAKMPQEYLSYVENKLKEVIPEIKEHKLKLKS